MEALKNAGFLCLGEDPAPKSHTLIVLGASRGGTSATAGVLAHLGIFLGNSGKPPMFEDLYLNRAIRENDMDAFLSRIDAYNRDHAVWAYKGTMMNRDLKRLSEPFRNPRYVIVFRDILAIAMRANLSTGLEVDAVMARQLREYARILDFLENCESPALLLSYEKLVLEPAPIVEALARFSGVAAGETAIRRALDFLSGPRDSYLATSRPGA